MNIFENQYYQPYGTAYGTQYPNQPAPQPKYTKPLTEEQQKLLQKTAVQFTTQIDQKDLWKSWCTHRKGSDTTLTPNADGSFTCTICGTNMTLEEYTKEDVQEICDKYNNLMNNIKVKYYDVPIDVVKDMCQIMPYVERTPKFYEIANDNFGRYVGYNPNINPAMASPNYGVWNGFNMIYGNQYGYQAPPQAPVQQPMQQGVQYVDYGTSPYGYGAPMSTMQQQQAQMVNGANAFYTSAPMNTPQAPVQQPMPQQAQPAPVNPTPADTQPKDAGNNVQTKTTVAL